MKRVLCLLLVLAASLASAIDLTGRWFSQTLGGTITIKQSGNDLEMVTRTGFVFKGHIDTYRKVTLTFRFEKASDVPGNLPPEVKKQLIGQGIRVVGYADEAGRVITADVILRDVRYNPQTFEITSNRDQVTKDVRFERRADMGPLLVAQVVEDLRTLVEDVGRGETFGPTRGKLYPTDRHRLLIVTSPTLNLGERRGLPNPDSDAVQYEAVAAWENGRNSTESRWLGINPATLLRSKGQLDTIWEEGFKMLAAQSGKSVAELKAQKAALVLVYYQPNLPVGEQRFSFGGGQGSWQLEQGSNQRIVRFVRKVEEGVFEEISQAIPGEEIYIEVLVTYPQWNPTFDVPEGEDPNSYLYARRPPFDTVEVVVGLNGVPVSIASLPTIECDIVPRTAGTFRSGPILLNDEGAMSLDVNDGDRIQASVADPTAGPAVPPVVSLPIVGLKAPKYLFREGVLLAAIAHNISITENPTPEGKVVEEESNLIITEAGFRTTQIRIGQVAAMILLRDRFVDLMTAYITEASKIDETREFMGFLKLVAPTVLDGSNPIGTVMVSSPAGEVTFKEAISEAFLRERFPNRAAAQVFLVDATKEAHKKYLEASIASRDKAKAIKNHESVKLLELTSSHFQAVVNDLVPDLVKPVIVNGQVTGWEPDRLGRSYVKAIQGLGDQLRAQRELSSIDTQVALAVVSVPLLLSPASLIVTVLQLAQGAYDIVDASAEWISDGKDREFALGAAPILGRDILDEAMMKESPWWKHLLSLAAAGVGLGADVLDAVRLVKLGRAQAQAADLLSRVDPRDAASFARLSKEDQSTLLALMGDARNRASLDPDALTDLDRQLIGFSDQLVENFANAARRAGKSVDIQPFTGPKRSADLTRNEANSRRPILENQLADAKRRMAAAAEGSPEYKAAKAQAEDLESRVAILKQLDELGGTNPAKLERMTSDDVLFAAEPGRKLTDDQIKWLHENIIDRYGDWGHVVKAFNNGEISQAEMHRFIAYRQSVVDGMLKQAMDRVNPAEGVLKRKAFGSTNLTSDYDISIEGPGAERVVAEFNALFRNDPRFKGLEPGSFFDTNVYTDPIYSLHRGPTSHAPSLDLDPLQQDNLRQVLFDQMASRKYLSDAQWEAHKRTMLENSTPEMRPVMQYALDQAEQANRQARALADAEIAKLPAAMRGTENGSLRATNELYSQNLSQIDKLRNEMKRLDDLAAGRPVGPPDPDLVRTFGGGDYQASLNRMNDLINQRNRPGISDAEKARLTSEIDKIKGDYGELFTSQMRTRQGLALYYASEAYQTEGAIEHVVYEIQKNKKVINGETLTKPVDLNRPGRLTNQQYSSSFYENRANMFKELNHAREGGNADPRKLAAKAAKYFIRQLDAANELGIKLTDIAPAGLIDQVVLADRNRGKLEDLAKVFAERNIDLNSFVTNVEDMANRLAGVMISRSELTRDARRINDFLNGPPR